MADRKELFTPREILDLPVGPNDSGAGTVRGYLVALLSALWEHQEGFSGKRPFGNIGWKHDLFITLIAAGAIDGILDPEEGYINEYDRSAAHRVIAGAIKALGETGA